MGKQYNTISDVPIASFETSWKNQSANQPLESVVVPIFPTQNLNGYEYPWGPGDGKNKVLVLLSDVKSYNTAGVWIQNKYTLNGVTFDVNAKGNAVDSIIVNGTPSERIDFVIGKNYSVEAGDYILNGLQSTVTNAGLYIQGGGLTSRVYEYGSGVDITLTTAAFFLAFGANLNANLNNVVIKPMIRLATESNPEFLPYENVCPIIGKTNMTVSISGKNLFEITANSSTFNGITATVDRTAGLVTLSGIVTSGRDSAYFSLGQFNKKAGVAYTMTGCPSGGGENRFRLYVQGKGSAYYDNGNGVNFPISDVDETITIRCIVYNDYEANDIKFTPMIRLTSETDNTFMPYSGSVYPLSWQSQAGTVYSGTVDVISGSLVATMAEIPSYNGEQIGEPWLSSMDRYGHGATPTTGAQVVYTLATPQTYQFTGQQINTLLGVNNVWADIGEINSLTWQYSVFDLLQVFINGYDITDLIAFGGWQRERNDVDGPEAGRTLDAKMHRARVTTKMRYNVTCRPMLAGELASLERLIMPEYVTVKVIGDPYYGTWERTCYVNNTSAKYLIRKRNGTQWWGGITFPIIEV